MRAFLVKLNYGLQDLSYIEVGECGSMQVGVHHDRGRTRKRRTTEFYMEWYDVNERGYQLTCIPMHVHKLEDGVKLGAPCSRQKSLHKVFSLGREDLTSGEFVLEPNKECDFRFHVKVRINREIFSLHWMGSVLRLKHGDIIELFLDDIPYFRVMFLLTNEYSVQLPQTSVLLSFPWPVLRTIFRFLTPFEIMESIVPVCQQFFQLMRSGAIWTHLKVNIDFETYVPYGHLDDLCRVIAPRIKKLVVDMGNQYSRYKLSRCILRSLFESDDWRILKVLEIHSLTCGAFVAAVLENREFFVKLETLVIPCVDCVSLCRGSGEGSGIFFPNVREVTLQCCLRDDFSDLDLKLVFPGLKRLHLIDIWTRSFREIGPNFLTFLDILGSGVLRSLHAGALPFKLSNDDWLLAQRRGTFANLELLTVRGEGYLEDPLADMMCDAFPKLKSIWFQNVEVSPTNAIDQILNMPSVEKIWFRNAYPNIVPEPTSLYFFDQRPKEWLENIKLISADTLERYIPYSRMINLEFVAFLRYERTGVTDTDVDGTLPRSLESIFEELRNCSKLKGLIIRIPDGFRCTVLEELSQKLEFAAISGDNIEEVRSALECLVSDQTRLEEVWIRVFDTSGPAFKKFIEILMRFKRLREVVFVYTPHKHAFDDYGESETEDDLAHRIAQCRLENFERELRKFGDLGCCWKRATLLFDARPCRQEYLTYSFELRGKTEFSSSAVKKFFSDWFNCNKCGVDYSKQIRAANLISALFPK